MVRMRRLPTYRKQAVGVHSFLRLRRLFTTIRCIDQGTRDNGLADGVLGEGNKLFGRGELRPEREHFFRRLQVRGVCYVVSTSSKRTGEVKPAQKKLHLELQRVIGRRAAWYCSTWAYAERFQEQFLGKLYV